MMDLCGGIHRCSYSSCYLDAVLEQEPWCGEALFFIKWFAEYDDLFKEENPPLFTARQKPCILICDQECVLQEQFTLGNNFTLEQEKRSKGKEKKTKNIAF
jgi:hypothetical protein